MSRYINAEPYEQYYEYTKKYRAFQAEMKAREKAGDQLMLTDL